MQVQSDLDTTTYPVPQLKPPNKTLCMSEVAPIIISRLLPLLQVQILEVEHNSAGPLWRRCNMLRRVNT